MPWPILLGLGGIAVAAGAWGVASAVVPSLNDPNQALNRVARRLMAGPRSSEEARKQKEELATEVKSFIIKNAKLSTQELVKKIETTLASTAFEVHGFDLPRNMRIIEIDTILQASEFLVLSTASGTKVIPLSNIEVFDRAEVVKDQTGSSLVIIGHSGGTGAHRPQIKVYALLPDDVRDESATAVPVIIGDGAATFAPNHKDIIADLSLYSIGVADHTFKPWPATAGRAEEETVRENLVWTDGKYTLKTSLGNGALSALYAVARCLQKPSAASDYEPYLSSKATRFLGSFDGKLEAPNFGLCKVSVKEKRHSAPTIGRLLLGGDGKNFLVELQQSGKPPLGHVLASNISKASDEVVALGLKQNPQIAAGIKSPDGGMDPALNPHEAQIIEKKPEITPEPTSTSTTIEDKIIASASNNDKGNQTKSDTPDTSKQSDNSKSQKSDKGSVNTADSGTTTSTNTGPVQLKNAVIIESGKSDASKSSLLSLVDKNGKKKTPAPIMIQTAPNTTSKPLAMVPTKQETAPVPEKKPDTKAETKVDKSSKADKKTETKSDKNSESKTDKKSDSKSDDRTKSEKTADENNSKRKNESKRDESESTNATRPARIASRIAGAVRIRSGPGGEYREIGSVTRETQFTIIGEKRGWYKVRANGQVGYVLATLVSSSGGPSNITVESSPTDTGGGSKSSRHHRRDRDYSYKNSNSYNSSSISSGNNSSNISSSNNSSNTSKSSKKHSRHHDSDSKPQESSEPPAFVP